MSNMTNELTQWLQDFANANEGGFDADQVQRLLEAADRLKAQEDALRQLQRSFCNLQADYAWEAGIGDFNAKHYADKFGWNCFNEG